MNLSYFSFYLIYNIYKDYTRTQTYFIQKSKIWINK